MPWLGPNEYTKYENTPKFPDVSNVGLNLIKQEEGCRLKAYKDTGGVWTIGWGNTFYEDGKVVKEGDVISQGKADRLLELMSNHFMSMIEPHISAPLNQNQVDSLVSFVYNVGPGRLKDKNGKGGSGFLGSTLRIMINTGGSCSEITEQFARWNKDNGVVNKVLTRRRAREAALYCK